MDGKLYNASQKLEDTAFEIDALALNKKFGKRKR
jgi:hypothetical protein